VFWPDLKSAQYAKDTLTRLKELKIEYFPKEKKPNYPKLRPIENFWANLKRKVYSRGRHEKCQRIYSNNYRPQDVKCLIAKTRKDLKSIETTGIRKVMKEQRLCE
jgi:hypothetical protein